MRISRGLHPISTVLAFLLFAASIMSASGGTRIAQQQTPQAQPQEQPQQPQAALSSPSPALLKGAADYCELVKKMALYFVCREKVEAKENVFSRGNRSMRSSVDALRVMKVNRQDFLFDYQIIKKGSDFQEKRILLEQDGKPMHKENAELNTLKASAQNLFFGPVGFLSKYWQGRFRYEVLGEEAIGDKKAVIVRAIPSEARSENNNPGRLWLDPDTFQILRIEFEPQFQDTDVNMSQDRWLSYMGLGSSTNLNFTRHFTWTVDYGPEKNGIRFPARQTIVEEYRSDRGYRITKRSIVFDYSNYQFFTVDVEVKN